MAQRLKGLPSPALDCWSGSGRIVFDSMRRIEIKFEYMYGKKYIQQIREKVQDTEERKVT